MCELCVKPMRVLATFMLGESTEGSVFLGGSRMLNSRVPGFFPTFLAN